MNGAIAFDTHRFVKRLTDCGFTERQAETLADEQVALLDGSLATKADVAETGEALRAEIARVETALRAEIAGRPRCRPKSRRSRPHCGPKSRVETALRAEIVTVKTALQADIAAVKADLLKWMFAALIAQGGLIVALVKLL